MKARRRTTALGRRYAKALLDVAKDQKKEEAWGEEMAAIAQVFEEEPLVRRTLTDPLVRESRRKEVVEALIDAAKPSEAVAGLLREMLAQDRMGKVAEVALAYRQLLDVERGIVEVDVATAKPLPEEKKDRLRKTLESLTGQQVRLAESVDESLIGGVVARVGDTVYDASVRGRLEQIRSAMAGAAE